METGGEIIESSVETEVDRTGYRVETKEKEKEIHKTYADIVRG